MKDEAERLKKWEKDRIIEQDKLRDIIEAREAEEARIIAAKDVYEEEKDKAEKVFLHYATILSCLFRTLFYLCSNSHCFLFRTVFLLC